MDSSGAASVVIPGEFIAADSGYLRGHGTFVEQGSLTASVAGVVERINKLVTVRSLRSRYTGDVGDVVVGRIREVGSKRWRVDVGGRQDAVLMLSSVNLESGEQRRRTVEDQMSMREYYEEGDLLSAEVHSVFADGSLSLHARSVKYGKLSNGVLVCTPPALMKRLRQHFVTFDNGVSAVFGMNGWIFLSESYARGSGSLTEPAALLASSPPHPADGILPQPTGMQPPPSEEGTTIEEQRRVLASRVVSRASRESIARVHNSLLALSSAFLAITPDAVSECCRRSASLEPREMLASETVGRIVSG